MKILTTNYNQHTNKNLNPSFGVSYVVIEKNITNPILRQIAEDQIKAYNNFSKVCSNWDIGNVKLGDLEDSGDKFIAEIKGYHPFSDFAQEQVVVRALRAVGFDVRVKGEKDITKAFKAKLRAGKEERERVYYNLD